MNRKFEELNHGIAVQVVAQKIADGRIDPLASFDALVTQFRDAVLKLADDFGEKDNAAPAKPKRATRKAAEPNAATGGGKRTGIDPEELRNFLSQPVGGVSNPATLQEIANHFSVSKGVAERAIKALPGVKSGPGTKPEGQRGKAPTVYWVE